MKILNNNNENFKRLTRDERGLVGIGTLIVFIAVVIVAAVAAGVLINTSGTLQQQARATGQETITEVSSGAKVVAVKGYTDETGLVENLEVVVKPYPGTRGINLENMVIQFRSEENAYHLTYGGGEDADPGENFGIVRIQNVSGTQTGMLDQMGDIAKLVIQLNNKLSESEESSLMLIPSHGFESYYGLQVPHILKENRWYEL